MLIVFSGVEFLKTVSKFRKRKRKSGLVEIRHYDFLVSGRAVIVSFTAVFRLVTQRSSPLWGGALRDEPKNGCEGD